MNPPCHSHHPTFQPKYPLVPVELTTLCIASERADWWLFQEVELEGMYSHSPILFFLFLDLFFFFSHLGSFSCYCFYIRLVQSLGRHDVMDFSPFCPALPCLSILFHIHTHSCNAFWYPVYLASLSPSKSIRKMTFGPKAT